MPNFDLDTAIRGLVSSEVEKVLEPYKSLLERMAAFAGAPAPRRGPGRPPRGAAPVRRQRRGRGGGRRNSKGDASRFSEGQAVRYKQGRGIFDATVMGINAEDNTLTIQRVKDGKKIVRPAGKVYVA
jgi:hypothetical protein